MTMRERSCLRMPTRKKPAGIGRKMCVVAGRNVRRFVLKFECGVGAMRVERWHGARQNAGRALVKKNGSARERILAKMWPKNQAIKKAPNSVHRDH